MISNVASKPADESNKPLKLYAQSIYAVPCNKNPELIIMNRAAEEELRTKLRQQAKKQKVTDFQKQVKAQYFERKQEKKQQKDKVHKEMDTRVKDLLKDAIKFSVGAIKKKDEKVKLSELEDQRKELMKNTEALTKKLQTSQSKAQKPVEEKKEEKPTRLQEIEYARKKLAMHMEKEEAEEEMEPEVEIKDNRKTEGKSGVEIIISKQKKSKKNEDEGIDFSTRGFASVTPVLTILGIDNYDQVKDIDQLKLNFDQADEYQRIWKITDDAKFNELLRFKILQEVMSLEERKAVRKNI